MIRVVCHSICFVVMEPTSTMQMVGKALTNDRVPELSGLTKGTLGGSLILVTTTAKSHYLSLDISSDEDTTGT